MRPERYLQRLEDEKIKLAREAMERPAGRDPFDYGRAVGLYAGLEIAKTLLLDMFAEKERNDFNL